jgi:hypothetical protein
MIRPSKSSRQDNLSSSSFSTLYAYRPASTRRPFPYSAALFVPPALCTSERSVVQPFTRAPSSRLLRSSSTGLSPSQRRPPPLHRSFLAMVYITPGLFGHDHTHAHPFFSTSTHTHIPGHMVDSQLAAGLGKRKRRADDDADMPSSKHISISSTDITRSGSSTSRTSPTSEGHIRLYGHNPAPHEASVQRMFSRSPKFASLERRHRI